MKPHKRAQWSFCFGAVGALTVAGWLSGAQNVAAQSSDAGSTTPQPTPAGNQQANGRQLFDRACGRCHPGGEEDVGPRIINKNWDESKMTKQIRQGGGRMRPVPPTKLPDANLPALMAYLRTIHSVR